MSVAMAVAVMAAFIFEQALDLARLSAKERTSSRTLVRLVATAGI